MQSHAESAQTFQQFCPYRNQDFFLHIFPINKGPMLCTLSSGLGGLLTFYDPFLIKVDQPENLFSLEVFFLYTSNLCQGIKALFENKVMGLAHRSLVSPCHSFVHQCRSS